MEEEEPIDPFRGRVLRRSPPRGVLPSMPPEEPELPPTPTQKGLSDPSSINTSPLGIHNTPSKRARRSKALAEKLKSSPLKQPPLRPPLEHTGNLGKVPAQPVFARSRLQGEQDPAVEEPRQDTEGVPDQPSRPHPSREVKEFDPHAEKEALRDSLLAEVARLEADLELATKENDLLHRYQQAGRSQRESWKPEDERNILGLLRRHILPQKPEPPREHAGELLRAALNPISFLPFGKADRSIPPLFGTSQAAQKKEGGEVEEDKETPISHYPIPMSAKEELLYLQVFTPLTFTSTVSILPREDPNSTKPIMQKHAISISSNPPGLFAARVEMVVNTKTLAVSELSVPRLEPSAEKELRPFVENIVHGGSNSALTRNVSVMTWAMGEWVRVATRRARFWCIIERELTSREGIAKCVKQMRKGWRGRVAGRPALTGDTETDMDEEAEPVDDLDKADNTRFGRADLVRYLGKNSFDLELLGLGKAGELPSVRIQWKIDLDWTGEAHSKMGLFVAAPAKCKFGTYEPRITCLT